MGLILCSLFKLPLYLCARVFLYDCSCTPEPAGKRRTPPVKIYEQGNETISDITDLIDRAFSKEMQFLSGANEDYCKELLGKTAAGYKEAICLYIDLKLEMCNKIIES